MVNVKIAIFQLFVISFLSIFAAWKLSVGQMKSLFYGVLIFAFAVVNQSANSQSVCDTIFGSSACEPLDKAHERAGNPLDVPGRITRETAVETLGPVLGEAIRHSRDNARSAGTNPIPVQIKQALSVYFDQGLLNRVRYRIGQGHELSVQANSIRFGDAQGVALKDTIVFANVAAANDLWLWAHELGHIQQYDKWGLTDFSKRYVRDSGAVESEANDIANRFMSSFNSGRSRTGIPSRNGIPRRHSVTPPPPSLTRICRYGLNFAYTAAPVYVGQQCFVPGWGYGVGAVR
ncbi:MAG: DUF4157 domain-containing protein [Henriciella sp.]